MRLEMHAKDEVLIIIAPHMMKQTMYIYQIYFEQWILFFNTDTPIIKSYRQGRP
jgi:hypothetical protein